MHCSIKLDTKMIIDVGKSMYTKNGDRINKFEVNTQQTI